MLPVPLGLREQQLRETSTSRDGRTAVSAVRRRIVLFVCGVHALVPGLHGCDNTIGVATSLTDPEPWQI